MDYFQGVVTEYLRADRAVFVNTECLIQLDDGNDLGKGRHWYCDAVAANFRESTVYLCEITYSTTMQTLLARLEHWANHWPLLCQAVARDCCVPNSWKVQPWTFIPKRYHQAFNEKLAKRLVSIPCLDQHARMPAPKVTYLESVTPWNYCTWDRREAAFADDV
jgi:hypothetical protein